MNEELIKQARELCEKASTEKANGNAVDSAALSWAIAQNIVPRLCDALEAADNREEAQRWISVKERLPDDVGSYLVYYHEWSNGDFLPKYDDYRIRVMRFMNNEKWRMPVCTDKRCEADTNREVTHWQPLPQPPEKGE